MYYPMPHRVHCYCSSSCSYEGTVLDAAIIPPGEKPPPYDFTECHGGLSSDDVQKSAEREISPAPSHASEITQTQALTVMEPYHSPVFIPVGGVSTHIVVEWSKLASVHD